MKCKLWESVFMTGLSTHTFSIGSVWRPTALAVVVLLALPATSRTVLAQSTTGNPYLFQGARYDPETGFYYFRNRYYDPRAARFLQRDPVWDARNVGGWHTFVGNGPVSQTDALGLGDGAGDDSCPSPLSAGASSTEAEQVKEFRAAVNRLRRTVDILHGAQAGYRSQPSRINELMESIETAVNEIEPQLANPAVQPLLNDWRFVGYLSLGFGEPWQQRQAEIEALRRYEEGRRLNEDMGIPPAAPRSRSSNAADALPTINGVTSSDQCKKERTAEALAQAGKLAAQIMEIAEAEEAKKWDKKLAVPRLFGFQGLNSTTDAKIRDYFKAKEQGLSFGEYRARKRGAVGPAQRNPTQDQQIKP